MRSAFAQALPYRQDRPSLCNHATLLPDHLADNDSVRLGREIARELLGNDVCQVFANQDVSAKIVRR
jgi:hypothetical protein